MTNKISFTEFVQKLQLIEQIADESVAKQYCIEDFFDKIIESGISLESVITGDIAQVTKPVMMLKRKQVYEAAPKSKKAEEWILSNKSAFKKRYGDDWEQIIYATAHKLFGNKK